MFSTIQRINPNLMCQNIIKRFAHHPGEPVVPNQSHRFAYEGNPYETKIVMRRQVTDLNYPNFNEQECLKWADWRMLRDVKRRHYYAHYWQHRNNLKNLAKNGTLPGLVKDIAWDERMASPRIASINQTTNRCAISSRARGKFPRFRLSRNIWRELADHALLSGYIRAKWG